MKKGFTLIELLAVIIILAILMIIAVPNILSTLATARSSAFIAQAQSIYKAAEQQYIIDTMTGTASSCYDKNNLNLGSISSTITFAVQMNNNTGTVSSITINDTSQQLKASGTMVNNIALTTYANETLSCSGSSNNNNNNSNNNTSAQSFGGTLVGPPAGNEEHSGLPATYKGIVYLDPSDLTTTCTSGSTLTTTNTGCKKFYIFDDSGDTYKMIMWKNTTATVVWNSSGSNSTPNEVATALEIDTAGWEGTPRLITADEVVGIVDNGSWTNDSSNYFNFGSKDDTEYTNQSDAQKLVQRSYHWLFDYIGNCISYGCENADINGYGYWTSTKVRYDITDVWFVSSQGALNHFFADLSDNFGVRPVIELPKYIIS